TTFEETISQLRNNDLYSSKSNNSFLFYFQQPNDKSIYQVTISGYFLAPMVFTGKLNMNTGQERDVDND
ncbi:11208_t:CDS:2, partial [Funneliformis caledonium]